MSDSYGTCAKASVRNCVRWGPVKEKFILVTFLILVFCFFFPFSIQIQRHCFCLFLHSLFLTQLWLLEPELISGIWSLINNEVASSSKVSYEQLYEMDLKTKTMDSCSCDYSWCCWRVGIAIIITYYYLLLIASGFFLLGLCSFLETCSGSMMKHTTQCILCVWRGSCERKQLSEATQRYPGFDASLVFWSSRLRESSLLCFAPMPGTGQSLQHLAKYSEGVLAACSLRKALLIPDKRLSTLTLFCPCE